MERRPRLFDKAKIITVYNQKGGCGKTMLTMQLGGLLAMRGYKTLIIDMDRQQTASTWFARAEARKKEPFPATVISLKSDPEHLIGALRNFSEDFDFILIDCPPSTESQIPWAALNVSVVGIVPIGPVLDNIWASREAFKLGDEAKERNPDLKLFYVLSILKRGRIFESCQREFGKIDHIRQGLIPQLGKGLTQRNAYAECQWFGTIIHGLKQNRPAAAVEELDHLADDFLKVFDIKERAK